MAATATETAAAAIGVVTWRRHLPGANAINAIGGRNGNARVAVYSLSRKLF